MEIAFHQYFVGWFLIFVQEYFHVVVCHTALETYWMGIFSNKIANFILNSLFIEILEKAFNLL